MPDPAPSLPDAELDEIAVGLVRALRRAGVPVSTGATVVYARALTAVGSSATGAYWAGRATLVRRPEDVAAYDRVFGQVFGGLRSTEVLAAPRPVELRL